MLHIGCMAHWPAWRLRSGGKKLHQRPLSGMQSWSCWTCGQLRSNPGWPVSWYAMLCMRCRRRGSCCTDGIPLAANSAANAEANAVSHASNCFKNTHHAMQMRTLANVAPLTNLQHLKRIRCRPWIVCVERLFQ